MGKSLIIKGADFSANGIHDAVILDITSLVDASTKFYPKAAVSSFTSGTTSSNSTRCALLQLSISALVPDLSPYSKIRIDINSGYDFAMGMCRSQSGQSSSSNWFKLDGDNSSGGSFAWVTDKQYAEVDVSSEMYITGNIRHDDNETEFGDSAKFSDFATLKLIG